MTFSICEIILENNYKRLFRLCDVDGNGFIKPKSNERGRVLEKLDASFEDWEKVGSIGVWNWTMFDAYRNDRNQIWRVDNLIPTEIVECKESSDIPEMINWLQNEGLKIASLSHNLICSTQGFKTSLLFQQSDFLTSEHGTLLRKDVYSADILEKIDPFNRVHCRGYQNTSRVFYRSLVPPKGEPTFFGLEEVVADLVRQRLAENYKGSDLKALMAFIAKTPRQNIRDAVVRITRAPDDDVQRAVDAFLDGIPYASENANVDVGIIDMILEKSPTLFNKCIETVKAREPDELAEYSLKIAEAKAQLEQALKDLQDADDELQKVREETAKISRDRIGFQEEIESKFQEFQENTGKYLADVLGVHLFGTGTRDSKKRQLFARGTRPEDLAYIENAENPSDFLMSVDDYIGDFVKPVHKDLSYSLSAFLYSAFIRKRSLFFAGYGSFQLAEAFSFGRTGLMPDVLTLNGEWDQESVDEALSNNDTILVVKNPFNGEWLDRLLMEISGVPKTVIFVAPFVDDFRAEPKGLYDYAIPIVTSPFIVSNLSKKPEEMGYYEPTESFEDFKPNNERDSAFEKIAKELRFSGTLTEKISEALMDVRKLTEANNEDFARLTRFYFGLFPRAILSGERERFNAILRREFDGEVPREFRPLDEETRPDEDWTE